MCGVFPFLLLKLSTRALLALFTSLTTSDRMPRRTSCCSRMKGVSVTPAAPSRARPRPWSGAGASGVKLWGT